MRVINIGWLVDGEGGGPARNRQIIVEGERIVSVGPMNQSVIPHNETVVDAMGGTVLPGLIDAHVHLDAPGAGSDDQGGDPDELWYRRLYDTDALAVMRMARNGEIALQAGITTVRDCSSRNTLFLSIKAGIDRNIFEGPRLVACGRPITVTGGHEHVLGVQCDSLDEIRKASRQLICDGADFIKIMATGGFSTPGSGVQKSQYTVEEMRVAADEAHRLGRHIAAHAHAAIAIRYAVQAGIDTIEHCSWIWPEDSYDYGKRFDPEVVEMMAAKGICMSKAFGAVDRLKERLWKASGKHEWERHCRDREAHGLLTRQMYDKGVPLITGTDAGAGCTPINEIALALADWQQFCGLSAMEAIATVTSVPAKILGLNDVGILKSGNLADMIIVPGYPLDDLNKLSAVDTVIQGGRIVVSGCRLVRR